MVKINIRKNERKGYQIDMDTVPAFPVRDMPIAPTLCPCTIVPENRIPLTRGTRIIKKIKRGYLRLGDLKPATFDIGILLCQKYYYISI